MPISRDTIHGLLKNGLGLAAYFAEKTPTDLDDKAIAVANDPTILGFFTDWILGLFEPDDDGPMVLSLSMNADGVYELPTREPPEDVKAVMAAKGVDWSQLAGLMQLFYPLVVTFLNRRKK